MNDAGGRAADGSGGTGFSGMAPTPTDATDVLLLAHHKTGTALMLELQRVLAHNLPNASSCTYGLVVPQRPRVRPHERPRTNTGANENHGPGDGNPMETDTRAKAAHGAGAGAGARAGARARSEGQTPRVLVLHARCSAEPALVGLEWLAAATETDLHTLLSPNATRAREIGVPSPSTRVVHFGQMSATPRRRR